MTDEQVRSWITILTIGGLVFLVLSIFVLDFILGMTSFKIIEPHLEYVTGFFGLALGRISSYYFGNKRG